MGEEPIASLMRRKVRAGAAAPPVTPARALRLAAVRAAEASIGLTVAVLGIREEEGPLDDLLGRLEEGLLLLALRQAGEATGLVALDAETRSAAIEVQTLGQVGSRAAEPREPTAADAAVVRPFLAALLAEAEAGAAGTPLDGWLQAPKIAARVPGAREAGILLPDGAYRVVRLTLDLGGGGRQGLVVLLARLPLPEVSEPNESPAAATLAGPVLAATVPVTAELHRIRLAFGDAEALAVGQVLPLLGVTVAGIRLRAGGLDLGPARLGQVAGMRAVRLEEPLAPGLADIPALSGPEF